jgi:hypothetical protein
VSEDAPSWVTAPVAARPVEERAATPAKLRVLLVLTVALVATEVAHVASRVELVVGFRAFLVAVVGAQVPLAWFVGRRSAGAALATLVYQGTTVVAALVGGFGDLRPALAAGAAAGFVLLATSLDRFPTPTLPPITPNHQPPDGP